MAPSIDNRWAQMLVAYAAETNSELTILLNGDYWPEVKASLQRLAWTASSVLNLARRRGVRPSPIRVDRLVELETMRGGVV